jgi:hypothetical protein
VRKPSTLMELTALSTQLCRTVSGDLCSKVVINTHICVEDVLREDGGHDKHPLH